MIQLYKVHYKKDGKAETADIWGDSLQVAESKFLDSMHRARCLGPWQLTRIEPSKVVHPELMK